MAVSTARAIGAIMIACCALAIVLNTVSESDISTAEYYRESVFDDMFAVEHSQTEKKPMGRVVKHIVDLKAYSAAALSKARKLKSGKGGSSSGKKSSLVAFIVKFGSDVKNPDLVSEYANTIGHLRARFNIGLGAYLLDSLNAAILTGKGVVIVKDGGARGTFAMFNHSRLGLQSTPDYFRLLKVRLSAYLAVQTKLKAGYGKDALKNWLLKAEKGSYHTFLAKITAKWRRLQFLQNVKEEAGAKWSEDKAWKYARAHGKDAQAQLNPMPPAGAAGGATVRKKSNFYMPSYAALKKQAMKLAVKYMNSLRKSSTAEVISAIEAKLEGVKLKFSTSAHNKAGSDQSPKVKITGTRGTITGLLKALPLRGKTMEQTLTGKSIGNIISIELQSSSPDAWLCTSMSVRSGVGRKWVKMAPYTFWLGQGNEGMYRHGVRRTPYIRLIPSSKFIPTYKKKYSKKWPKCDITSCKHGDLTRLSTACTKDPKCNGFSYTAGKKLGGEGCMYTKCGSAAQEASNGFGYKKFDYYKKRAPAVVHANAKKKTAKKTMEVNLNQAGCAPAKAGAKYCVVVKGAVTAVTSSPKSAKLKLASYPHTVKTGPRMICEVNKGVVEQDATCVGGMNQGHGSKAGFNKFWWNEKDIYKMQKACAESKNCVG